MLDVEYLKQNGGFVGAPVLKEIKWESGDKEHLGNVYVAPRSYAVMVAESKATNAGTDLLNARIAARIVNDKGLPIFTPEIITGDPEKGAGAMCESLFLALVNAMNEVDGFVEDKDGKK